MSRAGFVAPLALGLACVVAAGLHAQEATGAGSSGTGGGGGTESAGAAPNSGPVSVGAPAAGTTVNTGIGPGSGFTPGIGSASTILPATGFGGGIGSVRDFVNTPVSRARTRVFEVNGSIGVQAGYNDNVLSAPDSGAGGNRRQGSFETRVSPGLVVSAEGRRVQLNLSYDPVLFYYPQVDSQSRIDQFLNASASGEIIPQLFYLDLRAFTTQTSTSNAYGPVSTSVLNRQDRQQITSFSVNPYLVHGFGSVGNARISYRLDSTNSTSQSTNPNVQNSIFNTVTNGHTLTQSEDASFTTGEDFGRFQHILAIGASQFNGTSTRSGHRNQATYDLAFAYNRFVTLTARVGYQDILYAGTTFGGVITSLPYKLQEPMGTAGFKLTPNADSSLTFSYGHVDGGESIQLDAAYKPTARIALYATSSSGVTTDAQQVQSYVSGSQVTATGVAIDPRTGAPVQFSNASNNASTANQVYRLTRSSLTAAYILTRDTFNISLIREERANPGGAAAVRSQNSTSTYGMVSWQHDLSPNTSTNLSATYGVQDNQAAGGQAATSNPTMSVTGIVTRNFTEKLSGTMNYSFFHRDSSLQTQRVTVNEFLLGLVQRF